MGRPCRPGRAPPRRRRRGPSPGRWYLPPAISTSPGGGDGIGRPYARGDSFDVDSDSPASSGRRPAVHALHVMSRGHSSTARNLQFELAQHVVDIGPGRRRVGLVQRPVRVGRPDDPVPPPRDDEQHADRRPHDDPGRGMDPVPRHHQVHPLGRPDVDGAAAAWTSSPPGSRPRSRSPLAVASRRSAAPGSPPPVPRSSRIRRPGPRGKPLAFPQEPRHLSTGGDLRAVAGRRPHHRHHVPGVVHLSVPVHQPPRQRRPLQRRRQPQRTPAGQLPVTGQARGARPIDSASVSYAVTPAPTYARSHP